MRKLLFAFLCAGALFAQDNVQNNVFKFRLGDLQIAAIKDQDTNMGRSILTDPASPIAQKLLADDQNPSSINCFLIVPTNAEENITLIDSGLGGGLFDGLQTLKIPPENIGSIVITHMHRDHIGGLTKEGAALFANAIVYVPKNDLAYWLGSSKENAADAKTLKTAYKERLKTYEWGKKTAQIYASVGITAIRADGHTPGHSVLEIESGGKKFLIVSDLIHSPKVQFADPTQTVRFDVDAETAAKTRVRILNYAANAQILIAGMHIPFPGIGAVKKSDDGFTFAALKASQKGGVVFVPMK